MKFSIVTPAYNSEAFIRETIESVLSQKGDFRIEYLILDNESTDATPAIVREYQQRLDTGTIHVACRGVTLEFVSQRDSGMYEAIGRGFDKATGDVYAWINSDDIYLPGAFDAIERTLACFPEISWIKGITTYMNSNSNVYYYGKCHLYRDDFIRAGLYGPVLHFIQQDSVFWKAELWRQSGGVKRSLSVAGDYFLWKAFAGFSSLYSLNVLVSSFRKTENQKSADMDRYWDEIKAVGPADERLTKLLWRFNAKIEALPRAFRSFLSRLLLGRHSYRLVLLEGGVTPRLFVDDDYHSLSARTHRS